MRQLPNSVKPFHQEPSTVIYTWKEPPSMTSPLTSSVPIVDPSLEFLLHLQRWREGWIELLRCENRVVESTVMNESFHNWSSSSWVLALSEVKTQSQKNLRNVEVWFKTNGHAILAHMLDQISTSKLQIYYIFWNLASDAIVVSKFPNGSTCWADGAGWPGTLFTRIAEMSQASTGPTINYTLWNFGTMRADGHGHGHWVHLQRWQTAWI